MKTAIITGSSGLIGSHSVKFLHSKGFKIIGIDNNMRQYFFGDPGSTAQSTFDLKTLENYTHFDLDIRSYLDIRSIFSTFSSDIEIVIHTAAQPSHDWASKEPLTDFTINALGTMNLLELTRIYCPRATFIFTSSNKVYGELPNSLNIIELDSRYEAVCPEFPNDLLEVDENMSIDKTKHSIFGASKVSADIMVQEYGKYFGLNTVSFRGGCLTGPNHAGTELHGFLSYLVKCMVNDSPYTIFGYKGKQVRDNIHATDLVNMFWHFHMNPRQGEVYNAGGGRENSTSILEAIESVNRILGKNWKSYNISDQNRVGDHIWYISSLNKFKKDYPNWNIKNPLSKTLKEMVDFEIKKKDL